MQPLKQHADNDHHAGGVFFLIFGLLVAGIVTAGCLAYRNYARHYRAEVARELSAIADLKVGELKRWRQDRLADGALFFENASISDLVRRSLKTPEDADARRQLQTWLGKYQGRYQYDRAFLLDPQGVVRMSAPLATEPVAALISRRTPALLRSGQVALQDFYRDEHNQRVYLAVMVPILDASDANRPLGVLVLRIDPATYLYPFIERWPIPSQTAETLLVRREGNEAVFLNELRFQTNTALNLRATLDHVTMPAVQAALGREGIIKGLDYRGTPVVAALRAIPDSPWALVARMDGTEIEGPLRERLGMVAVMVAILLFGAGAGVGLVWRQQRVRFYRERAAAAAALTASEIRYRRFFEATRDGVLILDAETGMVLEVNPFLIELLGYPHEVFLGKKVWELSFFKDLVANENSFAEWRQKEYLRDDDMTLETREGRRIEVEFTSHVYLVNRQNVIQCNVRDISARKRAEQALEKTAVNLERSNKELEQFAYIASHDLQEPLRMVASYTQLLAKRYKGQLDQDAQDFIGYAVDGAMRMQRLINDLLTYSRVQTQGKSFGPVDAHSALGMALVNLAAAIEESGAIVTNDDLPMVKADHTQLVQLFQNLIGNALKFRGEARPHVHVSVERGTADPAPASGRPPQSDFWTFSVRDNGIGIEPPYFERIFVVFQRLHGQAKYPGTGIGLALCKRIVERHGGRIWVESAAGQGATFHFTLPGVE